MDTTQKKMEEEKILLMLLPFWLPLIPPTGIASLKSHLKPRGFRVKTVDLAIYPDFRDLYDRYFDRLKATVDEEKQGNFYSVGHDVLRNHMIAHLFNPGEADAGYLDLVETVIQKTFYVDVEAGTAQQLDHILGAFYRRLEEVVLQLLEDEKPTVLGLSVYSDTLPASLFTFRLVRERFPGIKTVMGGGVFADQLAPGSPNFKEFCEKTASYIDRIFIGEGELLFLGWLRGELPHNRRVYTLDTIGGETLDLSTATILDLEDFPIADYPYMVSYTSRSCPYQCKFCSETVQWGNYRKKSPTQIVKELEELYDRYGYQLFLLSDSLLNPVIRELAAALSESRRTVYWDGWLRVDGLDFETRDTMAWRRGGFYHARMGIESASSRVLDLMSKRITPDQIKKALVNLAYAGIKTTTLWIVGYPGETEADFLETLDFLETYKNEIYEAECRPFYYYPTGQPGSGDFGTGDRSAPYLLYPEESRDLLLLRTWAPGSRPSREETYERMNRFVRHCRVLGIPNPYSMQEIYDADERWRKLQKNAVPPLVDFKNRDGYIDECKGVREMFSLSNPLDELEGEEDFLF